jgi:pimeloyl-ACP methyl ester carboxylesterase
MSKNQTIKYASKQNLYTKKIAFQEDSIFAIYNQIDCAKQTLIFIHGAPGSWDAFKKMITHQAWRDKFNVIAFDRPGYGQSSKIKDFESLKVQSLAIASLLDHFSLPKATIITHSYGGPIGAVFAGANQGRVDNLVLLSPVIDPYHEKIFWYSYVAIWPWTKWILPKSMRRAGTEKKTHAKELKHAENLLKQIKCKVLFMHSYDDFLAPGKENEAYIRSIIPKENLRAIVYEDKGHMFMMFESENTIKEIDAFLGK